MYVTEDGTLRGSESLNPKKQRQLYYTSAALVICHLNSSQNITNFGKENFINFLLIFIFW
jgi:hypothetical protein